MSTYPNPLTDYSPQMEFHDGAGEAFFNEGPTGVLSESEEMELASEFLEIGDEAEMEEFLGKLIHKVGHGLGKFAKSETGQQLVGVLKNVAKTALPIAGGAIGGVVGGPPGALIGSNLASIAGSVLGLELEGLSPEDKEFEASKQFVRFAAETVANALEAPSNADPAAVAHEAAVEAARVHAPGLTNIALEPPGGVFSEAEEMDLAAEFMEIGSEAELDQFLGDLVSGIGSTLGKLVGGGGGNALGGILKNVAKTALPIAGGALGGMVGGPVGAMLGSNLAGIAGGVLGLEMEGLSPEDREFEGSRQFIRFAGETVAKALQAPPDADPVAAAHQAAVEAARVHAPGLMKELGSTSGQDRFNQKGEHMNHDIDRTQVGYAQGGGQYAPGPGGTVFNEDAHTNLASALMEVNSEQELDYFLGDVISGAADAVGKFVSSPTGQALGSGLKSVAKQLLPVAGQAVGGYFGGGTGAQVGGALGSAAAGLLDSEMEEAEWEAANTFVSLAGEATKKAAEMPPGADPQAVAHTAIVEAAKIHAPHLVPGLTGRGRGHGRHCGCPQHRHGAMRKHGRWYRHGDRVVLVGV